jgi:hypothetical protein
MRDEAVIVFSSRAGSFLQTVLIALLLRALAGPSRSSYTEKMHAAVRALKLNPSPQR